MRGRLAAVSHWGLLTGITAGALAVLAACGSVVAGGASSPVVAGRASAAPAAVALCADLTRLDRLTASLTPGLPQTHLHQALPESTTLHEPARVRAVAAALCQLPKMPATPVSCPADFGGAYRLSFAAAGQSFAPVTVRSSGCRAVLGLGPARRSSAAFWRLLTAALAASVGQGAISSAVSP